MADFKTQQEDNIPKRFTKLVQTYRQSLLTEKNGKLKDTKIKLHINESIPPVSQAKKPILFSLRESVCAEIKNLEEQDIIEDVTSEATPWLSQLVIVAKPGNTIRLCTDMRNANKAIETIRFPTPTVDDITFQLKNAQSFTKLDLNVAFHQLDEQSRYITAFQIEDCIERFKRLIFGLNSAPKQLHHCLQILLVDISGVINIADDILIFASTIAEHDLILQKVFQRLSEKGLILNIDKCLFSKETLEYFDFIFSKNSTKPSVSKIFALKEAKRPQDIKGICSYLDMINYLKRFILDFSTLTYPTCKLTHHDIKIEWKDEFQKGFQTLNNYLTENAVNEYFDKKALLFTVMHLLSVNLNFIAKGQK